MNRKNLFSVFYKTECANSGRYANADKFIKCATVIGNSALDEKIAELKEAGLKIDSIYNGIGNCIWSANKDQIRGDM